MSNTLGRLNLVPKRISELVPADYNPRTITDKARMGLSNSIDTFGLVQPIIYNKRTSNIVGGHQRLSDLIVKGVKETDVVELDISIAEEKALNIALNSQTIQGNFDQDLLTSLIKDISIDTDTSHLLKDLNLDSFEFINSLPEKKEKVQKETYGEELRQLHITLNEDDYIYITESLKHLQKKYMVDNISNAFLSFMKENLG